MTHEHIESDYEADGGDSSNLNKTTLGVMQKQCVVEAVLPGSPAEDYLKKGDLIVSVNYAAFLASLPCRKRARFVARNNVPRLAS